MLLISMICQEARPKYPIAIKSVNFYHQAINFISEFTSNLTYGIRFYEALVYKSPS